MKTAKQWGILLLLLAGGVCLSACPQEQQASDNQGSIQAVAETELLKYEDVSDIFANSCMPCHNHEFLPQVIQRLEADTSIESVDGESRERILAELYGLKARMDDNEPISFVNEEQVIKFLKEYPGEMYLMLEKGVMPAVFAEDLMQKTQWPKYTPITPENRMKLLRFAKPYSKDYLR